MKELCLVCNQCEFNMCIYLRNDYEKKTGKQSKKCALIHIFCDRYAMESHILIRHTNRDQHKHIMIFVERKRRFFCRSCLFR